MNQKNARLLRKYYEKYVNPGGPEDIPRSAKRAWLRLSQADRGLFRRHVLIDKPIFLEELRSYPWVSERYKRDADK